MVDGVPTDGFFASDFTLAEIKQLRAVQSFAERDQSFNGKFRIPTLAEVIELAKRKSREEGRRIGIYPETKHPTYHQSIGLPLEDRLLAELSAAGWNHRNAPVFIQSFETANLRTCAGKTSVRLVQLVDANDVKPDGIARLHAALRQALRLGGVATAPAPSSDLLTPARPAARSRLCRRHRSVEAVPDPRAPASRCRTAPAPTPTATARRRARPRAAAAPPNVIANAHAAGPARASLHLPQRAAAPGAAASSGNPVNEYLTFYEAGVDGLFSDFADTARVARFTWQLKTNPELAECLKGEKRGKQCAALAD